jgi:hypothetical protein
MTSSRVIRRETFLSRKAVVRNDIRKASDMRRRAQFWMI